ncbi:AraC family transcriptional regulator [Bacillus sp. 31A1R]|uniref:AraC family transcriptional regulator n=1 Tax=Robertmurraya mangrovi TaxID=3098077 RepID=A0ABU5J3Y0_9BACI|nr:AraC family transcriptional regulator [Bacillus sp. 31A1R]MDZ5474046.1 AraC family transcriptional regulator [Bacillus sp. 31A1R]
MKLLSVNLPQSSLSIYQLNENTADEFHDHGPFYQISIPLLGEPFMEFHGETRKLEERAVTMVGEEHRNYANHEKIKLLLISLNQELLTDVLADKTGFSNKIEFAKWGQNSSEHLKRLGKKIIKMISEDSLEDMELSEVEWELASLLLTIQEGTHSTIWEKDRAILGNPALQKIITFIHQNYQEKVSNKELASQFQISQMHLYRLFQEHLGMTPNEYIRETRLKNATSLLQKSKKDITTISLDSGFGSLSSFERSFKKKYGVTPKEFRSKT